MGDGFNSIAAGFCGMVCGINASSLYVRKGVTSMKPMGTEWAKHICNVVQVVVGKKCIVRKSSLGVWYYTKLTAHSVCTGILDWSAVGSFVEQKAPNSTSDVLLHHYAVDVHDMLYGLTLSGRVACYKLLEEEPCWSIVAQPPPTCSPKLTTRAGKLVGWLSGVWRSWSDSDTSTNNGGCCISTVSVGVGSVWCLLEGHREVWQLVVSKLKLTTKWNWVKSVLPLNKDEEVVHFDACKSSVDGLYVVLSEKEKGCCKILSYSLNSEGSGRREIVYPCKYPCRAVAIACTIKKPNLCCEDGSCSFCNNISFSPRKRANEIHQFALGTVKKARLDYRSHLLNGVQFYFNESFLSQQVGGTLRHCTQSGLVMFTLYHYITSFSSMYRITCLESTRIL